MPGRLITNESRTGRPLQSGDLQITPVARSLRLQLGRNLGFIWNRPSAVVIEAAGNREVIPVIDYTRLAQWSIWGLVLAVALIAWLNSRAGASQTSKGE
jgi:hypothetical protein